MSAQCSKLDEQQSFAIQYPFFYHLFCTFMEKLLDFVLGLGLFGMVTSTIYTVLAMLAVRRFVRRKDGDSAGPFSSLL